MFLLNTLIGHNIYSRRSTWRRWFAVNVALGRSKSFLTCAWGPSLRGVQFHHRLRTSSTPHHTNVIFCRWNRAYGHTPLMFRYLCTLSFDDLPWDVRVMVKLLSPPTVGPTMSTRGWRTVHCPKGVWCRDPVADHTNIMTADSDDPNSQHCLVNALSPIIHIVDVVDSCQIIIDLPGVYFHNKVGTKCLHQSKLGLAGRRHLTSLTTTTTEQYS